MGNFRSYASLGINYHNLDDKEADIRIWAPTDVVFNMLTYELGVNIPAESSGYPFLAHLAFSFLSEIFLDFAYVSSE